MDAITDTVNEVVVVKKSAQVGWTAIIGNAVGYYIHQDPSPMLMVMPTVELAERWSKGRLAPMLRDTPALAARVGDQKSRQRGNTLREKDFPGGKLYVSGANSPSSLASVPVRVMLFDEVDRFPPSAGDEGDVIFLGRKRTTTFWNRRILIGGTPTIAGSSRIDQAYDQSDQRRYWVPCPHCGKSQVLKWEQVRWTDDEDANTALYFCADCDMPWSDAQRWASVRLGEWRAGRPFKGVAGFHINELYSPWRRLAETVGEFLEAKKGGVEQLKVFRNTALGETWQEQGEAPEWERLLERREDRPMGVVPRGALVLTAGVDNQTSPQRLEIAVWAWGPGLESWLVDTKQFMGSPADAETWDALAEWLKRDWPCESGGTMRISRTGIDTAGNFTQDVYAQLRRLRDPALMPLKGMAGWTKAALVTGPTPVDITAAGKKIKRGLRLWTVAVDVFKAELYRRLWVVVREDGTYPPGRVHLPEGFGPEEVKQLVAEELVSVKDRRGFSRREWKPTRPRNEQLDMAVYARAALSLLGADRYGDRFWTARTKTLAAEPAKAPAPDAADDNTAAQPAVKPALPPAVRPAQQATATRPTQQPAPRRHRWGF